MPSQHNATELTAHFNRLAPKEGLSSTPWPGLSLFRGTEPTSQTQVVYRPCLCLVVQGQKRVFLADEAITYDPMHYVVVSVAMPVAGQIIEASKKRPCLSLVMEFDPGMLSQLLLDMADEGAWSNAGDSQRAVYASAVTEPLLDAVERFLETIGSPMDRRVLGSGAAKEILYRVLLGPQGGRLREHAMHNSNTFRVARVVRYLEDNFDQPLEVADIAKKTGMSVSTLHHTFKSVTAMSPMQYLKKLRLHRARHIIVADGSSAGEAGHRVGYNSASQFSREFKRLFGVPPSRVSESMVYELPAMTGSA
jgi:AraC-like DNA-binding protein